MWSPFKEIVSRQNMEQGCFSLNPSPQLPWLLHFEPTVSIVSNTYWCHWCRGDIPWRCQRYDYIYEWRVSLSGVIDNVEGPTVSAIEEGRASSKSSLKIWLFSFYVPASSCCRYHSKFSSWNIFPQNRKNNDISSQGIRISWLPHKFRS